MSLKQIKKRSAFIVIVGLSFGLGACGGSDSSGSVEYNVKMGDFTPPSVVEDISETVAAACKSGGLIDEIKERGKLNWAIGISPPFGFKLEDGTWAGVEAQSAAELAKILGVDFSIVDYSYDVLPATLAAGTVDIIGAQLFATDTRKEVIDFSTPYYQAGQLYFVREDSAFQTIDDLNKPEVRFVFGTGTAQGELAKKYTPKATISEAPLRGQLLMADFIAAGQADSSMGEAAAIQVIFTKYSEPKLAAIGKNGRITGERATPEEMIDPFDVAFGVRKGDAAWKGCVDAWVEDLLTSKRINARLDYWLAQLEI